MRPVLHGTSERVELEQVLDDEIERAIVKGGRRRPYAVHSEMSERQFTHDCPGVL